MNKVGVILQARVSSERFPNKVLAKIEGEPLLGHIINRLKKIKHVDQIILATSTNHKNKPLVTIAKKLNIGWFTGKEQDVLDRFYQCALENQLSIIIRITGDCPLVDPKLIEEILVFFKEKNFDYVSNTIYPTYPDGLDIEIFSFKSIQKAWKNAKKQSEREHVTPYIVKNTKKFKIFNYSNNLDLSDLRWTVDYKEDLQFVRKIYRIMRPKKIFSTKSILKTLDENPKLKNVNSKFERNEGYKKSLQMEH